MNFFREDIAFHPGNKNILLCKQKHVYKKTCLTNMFIKKKYLTWDIFNKKKDRKWWFFFSKFQKKKSFCDYWTVNRVNRIINFLLKMCRFWVIWGLGIVFCFFFRDQLLQFVFLLLWVGRFGFWFFIFGLIVTGGVWLEEFNKVF